MQDLENYRTMSDAIISSSVDQKSKRTQKELLDANNALNDAITVVNDMKATLYNFGQYVVEQLEISLQQANNWEGSEVNPPNLHQLPKDVRFGYTYVYILQVLDLSPTELTDIMGSTAQQQSSKEETQQALRNAKRYLQELEIL
jgi:hypothetical protein